MSVFLATAAAAAAAESVLSGSREASRVFQSSGEGGGEPEDNSIYRGPHVDVPLVLDDESWKRLLSLAEAARTAVARQQAGVDEEDVRFLALLTAIE